MVRYSEALALAIEVALAAGRRLRDEVLRTGGPRGAEDKADIDTEVEAEILRPRLTRAFPDWGYRGEETTPDRPPRDAEGHAWLVDPNDGTRDFLRGYRGPAVSVGLLRDGQPVLGVVFAYGAYGRQGDLLAWAEGEPFTRNGAPVQRALEDRPLGPADVVTLSRAADRAALQNAACVAPARFLAVPSIAYRLALVAAGVARAGVGLSGSQDWDFAAAHALLRAVGCVLVDGAAEPIRYSREGVSQPRRGWGIYGGEPAVAHQLAGRPWKAIFADHPRRLDTSVLALPVVGTAIGDADLLARAQGCWLGQLAGDALGSQVEFSRASDLARRYPQEIWTMADGGTWGTMAGQPTDDSEMALALARSILANQGYDPAAAAQAYVAWLQSSPFDMGGTTSRALDEHAHTAQTAPHLLGRPATVTRDSQANGSLMRISPLGIWGYRLPPRDLAAHARTESALTHPHLVCQDACAVYTVSLAYAIQSGAAPREVYRFATDWAAGEGYAPTVRQALQAAAESPERQPPLDGSQQGWVLHALRNAFHQLLFAPTLADGIVRTIMRGGDTDTNAAIAGALLGAVHGPESIPEQWRLAILTCRPLPGRGLARVRPPIYWPVDALVLAERLLAVAPTTAGRGKYTA